VESGQKKRRKRKKKRRRKKKKKRRRKRQVLWIALFVSLLFRLPWLPRLYKGPKQTEFKITKKRHEQKQRASNIRIVGELICDCVTRVPTIGKKESEQQRKMSKENVTKMRQRSKV
jgi:hypothetical protein